MWYNLRMKNAKKIRVLILLATLSASILMISNIVAVKLWDFFGIAVDGGIIVFPLTYVLGDLIMELYGKKIANYIIYMSFFVNVLAVLIFAMVGLLPEYAGWGNQEAYNTILGFMPRVAMASLMAFVLSGLMNNYIFEKIKKRTGEKKLWMRFIGSSLVAKFVDSLIFETIAFLGVLSFSEFLAQAGFAYFAGVLLEIVLIPVSYFVVKKLKKYEISD